MPRYRKPAVGYYKDSKGRTRPITRRIGRRRLGKNVLRAPYPLRIQKPVQQSISVKSLVSTALNSVLRRVPFYRELYFTFKVAYYIYNNWDVIKELYIKYQQNGWPGLVYSKAVRQTVSTIQTKIIWSVIRTHIPKVYHDRSLNILSNVVDKITDEEIRYVKNYLEKNK